jgi:hypothetical protein
MQWEEEVILLEEEMRRCVASLDARARIWDGRGACDGPRAAAWDEIQQEGVRAYAASQANIYQ